MIPGLVATMAAIPLGIVITGLVHTGTADRVPPLMVVWLDTLMAAMDVLIPVVLERQPGRSQDEVNKLYIIGGKKEIKIEWGYKTAAFSVFSCSHPEILIVQVWLYSW